VQRMEDYCSSENGTSTAVDIDGLGKLGHGFSSVDTLVENDIGDGSVKQPTYMNASSSKE
jgi:hypothetical protein